MTWWKKAAPAQRLAQIDGALECGIAARIVARLLGAEADEVVSFAHQNGRKFGRPKEGLAKRRTYARTSGTGPVFDTARRSRRAQRLIDSYEELE